MQAAKQTLLLAPCMNLLRHPLWGRAQETYGEDPYHIGRLASAMVVGVQQHIAANAKHFMGYDIENGRADNNSQMDEQTLREIYGRHFRMVVQDAGVASVMASYNAVNGTKSTRERAHADRRPAQRLRVQGLRPQRLVGHARDDQIPDTSTLKEHRARRPSTPGWTSSSPGVCNYGQLESLFNTHEP